MGSGGVMLPHYSPLKVAESFTILAALFPGRIDLGLGRAAGTDPLTTFALQRDRRQAAPGRLPRAAGRAAGLLRGQPARGSPLPPPGRAPCPAARSCPQPWLLGSSPQSAIWAGELGLRYAFADFINPQGAEIAKLYRERFSPVRDLQAPRTAVAAWVLCAPSDEEAQRAGLLEPDDA